MQISDLAQLVMGVLGTRTDASIPDSSGIGRQMESCIASIIDIEIRPNTGGSRCSFNRCNPLHSLNIYRQSVAGLRWKRQLAKRDDVSILLHLITERVAVLIFRKCPTPKDYPVLILCCERIQLMRRKPTTHGGSSSKVMRLNSESLSPNPMRITAAFSTVTGQPPQVFSGSGKRTNP